MSRLLTLATTNKKATIIISPQTIAKEIQKQNIQFSSLQKQSGRGSGAGIGLFRDIPAKKAGGRSKVIERPNNVPFKISLQDCSDKMIECNEQKDLQESVMRKHLSSGFGFPNNLNNGVMRDIQEREDLSDSDEESDQEMTDMQ